MVQKEIGVELTDELAAIQVSGDRSVVREVTAGSSRVFSGGEAYDIARVGVDNGNCG
jgi:hypothetical protein